MGQARRKRSQRQANSSAGDGEVDGVRRSDRDVWQAPAAEVTPRGSVGSGVPFVLADGLPARPAQLGAMLGDVELSVLARMRAVRELREVLAVHEAALWAEAHERGGVSLSELGGVFGLNRQGAWNRSSRLCRRFVDELGVGR